MSSYEVATQWPENELDTLIQKQNLISNAPIEYLGQQPNLPVDASLSPDSDILERIVFVSAEQLYWLFLTKKGDYYRFGPMDTQYDVDYLTNILRLFFSPVLF